MIIITIIINYKNSNIGYCTHTMGSTNVKVRNYFKGEITLHIAQNVTTEQLHHYIP